MTVEEHRANQPEIRQNTWSLLPSEELHPTDIYMHADLAIKERALEKTAPAEAGKPGRYKPDDSLLAFLENL